MEDTLTTKKRTKEKDREFHESLENKARSKSSKTIFLGVYALTRPGRTEANRRLASESAIPFPRGSGDVRLEGVVENSSDRATGSVRKRKRTPSDGSSSQSSGDTFDAGALVASTKPAQHLRKDDSLTAIHNSTVLEAYHASTSKSSTLYLPTASTSKLPLPVEPVHVPPSLALAAPEAEQQPVITIDRKGKRRQSSIPCVEITERHHARHPRAASTVPPSHLERASGAAKDSDQPADDEYSYYCRTRRKRIMRRASSKDPDLADDLPLVEEAESQSDYVKASSAPLLSKSSTAFITFQDEETSQPCLASKEVTDLDGKTQSPSKMASSPMEQSTNTSSPPSCSTSPPDSQATRVDVPITAGEASLPPATALATPSEVPIECNPEETQPFVRPELICVSSSENEDEDLPLTNLALPTTEANSQVDSAVAHSPRPAKARANSASPAKKSVSWDVNDDRATYQQAKVVKQPEPPLPKQSTKKRSRQEYFAGEGEDYRPSDEEETSQEGSPESVKIRQESLDGFGSSPLTPLTSSNTRSISSKDSSALKSALRKSSDARAQLSKPLGTRHGREPSRRVYTRRDISDDSDDEMLISQVKAPIRRSQKTILQQAISSILPGESPRVLKASKSPSAPVTRVRQASSSAHTLFTRSRATGESADCRQCHRCETYQPRSKTLRCMTCQLAVCTTCLLEHYAGHPSYAATLAYMRSSEQKDSSTDTLDVADIDFKCPVCKYLCRCSVCLRGPFPKTSAVQMSATGQIAEVPAPMRRSESVLSSDADLEPLHWPGLAAGTSSRPNLKVRLRVDRPSSAASRLSKAAQAQARNCTISSAYHDLQDAIASEAARRAQVDAETDFVPVVSSRQPRRTGHGPLSPEQPPSSGSTTLSPSSSDSEAGSILVATSRRPRPTLSARVRFATKVGQQLGKSPAYVESRRSPRREGDQLIPYNDREPVLTLGPDADNRDDETLLLQEPTDYSIVNLPELGTTTSASGVDLQDPVPAEEPSNELLESLLALPDDENVSDAEADIPALEDHPSAEGDYLSPSDTVTTASGSSVASPPANDEKSVRFELPADSADSLNYLQADHRLSSIFLPGIEDDFNFPLSSPTSTPTTKSRFLQNPASPGTATKVFPTSSLSAASVFDPHLEDMYPFSYGSPSRNTAFDMDLMPEWNFDQFVHA